MSLRRLSERCSRRALALLQPMLRTTTSLQRMAAGLLLLVISALWITVGTLLEQQRSQALEAQMRQNVNLARVLEEQTVRVITVVDQAVMRLAALAADDLVEAADYQHIATSTGLSGDILAQLSLVDANGRFFGSNLDPDASKTGRIDLADREHVRVHLHSGAANEVSRRLLMENGLFIGKPVLGKVSGRWTIQLSRAVVDRSGQAVGVVVASLDPTYFEDLYRQVALGRQGGVSLLGGDGVVRARVIGGQRVGLGSSLAVNSALVRNTLGAQGSWIRRSSFDGVERLTAYQRSGDYPIYIFALSSVDEALAPWRSTRALVVGLAMLLSLVLGGAGVLVLGGVRRLESQHRALQISESESRAASQAKSEFLAAISHELRTPLTSIRGYAELIERRSADPRLGEQASMIRRGAEQLNTLLSEIMDLAEVDAGTMVFAVQAHRLDKLIDAAVAPFAEQARGKGLALRIHWQPGLPATIRVDAVRLRQMLANLLSNACKFTQQGSVHLHVGHGPQGWAFTVVDTGPGVPARLHEVIFEKFRQADARVSYQHGGTGLGLALSRSLARRLGGDITMESQPGQGARFMLRLPDPAAEPVAAAAA